MKREFQRIHKRREQVSNFIVHIEKDIQMARETRTMLDQKTMSNHEISPFC